MTDETVKKEEVAKESESSVPKSPVAETPKAAAPARKPHNRDRKPARPRIGEGSSDPELEERVVAVNRVAKVVKGGRRFSFSALMVVGDKKGNVGYGLGKAKEVPEAIRKATQTAKNNMIHVAIDKGTIPHQIVGEFDAGKVMFKPAADGTGIKAAGACRSILELVGIRNVLTKSLRGNNPHNIVKATFMALRSLRSPERIAELRGKDVARIRLK
ncbi:MAG: 30S ribosomal protein S5 [Bdellovibrionales bacterium]|jgi:small subunit ribosomal protein S5|nr:30S ribosomal protein S5 [Bdellovibrionales bacterium]MBT3526009.1 30S ribosomal protein S5 [Bdellovibrionales bacterium]MBT7668931.1 30S ribosomal protein S5 [Bdellovibrionales bacterium]MBT7767583.1 30S ribosomal protein S5 [Bdellovibrionales bacterium]